LTEAGIFARIEHMFDLAMTSNDHASDLAVEVSWQTSLFGFEEPTVDSTFAGLDHHWLDAGSWVDHLPRWLGGSDQVFAELVARVPWRHRVVRMYDRMVDEPRLTWWWTEADGEAVLPLPILTTAGAALSARYGRRFDSIGLNFYRDGRDSVAWHSDRVRLNQESPLVVIVSVGAPRPFLLRPRGGGQSRAFLLGQGDLLVMGGNTQHDWEHTVPKVTAAGPRISISYRHGPPEPRPVSTHPAAWSPTDGRAPPVGRARSSTSRNRLGANGWQHAGGVRVREHPAGTEAS